MYLNTTQKIITTLLTFISKYWFILLAFIFPIKTVFISVYILLLFDFITGIWSAVKQDKSITSKRMRDSVNKILAYSIIILLSLILEQRLLSGFPIVKFIGLFIGIVESYSICENLYKATGLPIFLSLMNITKVGKSVAVQKALNYLKGLKDKNE